MNILMLGWELPPHISGGLGVACEGLLNSLADTGEIDVTFFFPEFHGAKYEDTRLWRVVIPLSGSPRKSLRSAAVAVDGALHQGRKERQITDSGRLLDEIRRTPLSSKQLDTRAHDLANRIKSIKVGAYTLEIIHFVKHFTRKVRETIQSCAAFDIIHAHDWMTYEAAIHLKQLSGKKLIVHVHSLESDRVGLLEPRPEIAEIERRGLMTADMIVAVSCYTKRCIIDTYHIDPERISVVHNGGTTAATALYRHSTPRLENLVTFVGRITEQKGPEKFIAVAYNVWRRKNDIRFVMAGDGDLLLLMKSLVKSLGMTDVFSFPGFIDRDGVQELLARSSVFVMPSTSEPFGIAALEAIEASVPVIITIQSGVAEVVDNVIRVDPENIQLMTNEVLKIFQNPLRARARARRARREIDRITWLEATSQLSSIYLRVYEAGSTTGQ